MHYCLVCETHFKTIQSYNDHLSRKRHKTQIMKHKLIFSKDLDNVKHQELLNIINKCDEKKTKK